MYRVATIVSIGGYAAHELNVQEPPQGLLLARPDPSRHSSSVSYSSRQRAHGIGYDHMIVGGTHMLLKSTSVT
jgi:hypothetical protein